jgi:Ser/Thr protein kinase RdoA (MazF antagonist)
VPSPPLSPAESRAAESLLGVSVHSAEAIWDRPHILRLGLADGRSVVLKRGRADNSAANALSFSAEVAALSFLNGMTTPVAPRLLGANDAVLLMEDLGPASSLAHSLLGAAPARAGADLVAYARTLGAMHAWSFGRLPEFTAITSAAGFDLPTPFWLTRLNDHRGAFVDLVTRLGLLADADPTALTGEIDSLVPLMRGPRDAYVGLVHADACPDNTHIPADGGACRIFDFETSGWGPVVLDFIYLLAPLPSCWCFASLPTQVADPAVTAYEEELLRCGVALGPSWDTAVAAALGAVVVARSPMADGALDKDRRWGTTTTRPRTLTWLSSFVAAADRCAELPLLRAAAAAIHDRLAARWPDATLPDYPALARPGHPLAQIPDGWP